MSLKYIHIFKSVWQHPFNKKNKFASIFRIFKWQIISRLTKWDLIYPVSANTVMIARNGMTGVTGCIYSGLLEFEDMLFVLHSLNENDLFIDVGANVGIYSVLAAGERGAMVIAMEPIKKTFDILSKNIKLNGLESKVQTLNIGISDSKGELKFVSEQGTINHVLSYKDSNLLSTESVLVDTLDNICSNKEPLIIKIDVEGFETNVINGAKKIIENKNLKAIIIELNGLGIRYGFDEKSIHEFLLEKGFNCFLYEPFSRLFTECNFDGVHNTIYIRDIKFFQNRVKLASTVSIQGKLI